MDRTTIDELFIKWHDTRMALSRSKGHDYATEDILANFKRMYKACDIYDLQPGKRIEDVFLFYILIKLDRTVNLLHADKKPNNESLDDTMQDIGLYIELMRAYLEERSACTQPKTSTKS